MNKIFLKNSFWLMLALIVFESVYGAADDNTLNAGANAANAGSSPWMNMLGSMGGAGAGALTQGFMTPGGMFGAGGSILSSKRFKKNIKLWA